MPTRNELQAYQALSGICAAAERIAAALEASEARSARAERSRLRDRHHVSVDARGSRATAECTCNAAKRFTGPSAQQLAENWADEHLSDPEVL